MTYAEQVTAIYQAADALPTDVVGSGGEGQFMYSPSLGRGVFASHDLDAAPEDSVYELWLIDDAGPHPAGLFEPGEAVIVEGVEAGKVLALTVEPRGGSDLPTGPVPAQRPALAALQSGGVCRTNQWVMPRTQGSQPRWTRITVCSTRKIAEREGFEPSGGLYHPPLA